MAKNGYAEYVAAAEKRIAAERIRNEKLARLGVELAELVMNHPVASEYRAQRMHDKAREILKVKEG